MAVMLMGAVVYGVKYSIQEYLCTFLVAGGVSVFALFKVSFSSGRSVGISSFEVWKLEESVLIESSLEKGSGFWLLV